MTGAMLRAVLRQSSRGGLPCAALLWVSTLGVAAEQPRIVYSKSFPQSVPAYVEIALDKDGNCSYKEAPDDPNPEKFQLSQKETSEIFEIAKRLELFSRRLESGLKVANTGMKTFRWENGTEKHEVKFNYSQDPDAQLLWDWFERITETEMSFATLRRAARYDKLGVNQALLKVQASYERKRLVAVAQFLPVLERIAKNEVYIHMARTRAADLADAFRKEAE